MGTSSNSVSGNASGRDWWYARSYGAEGLQADDERIRARIEEIVAPYEQPDEVRNWIYGDEEQLQRIELDVLEDQLVEHVLAKATVESVAATYKDVVTGNSIPALPVEETTSGGVGLEGTPLERDDADAHDEAPSAAADAREADKPPKGRLRRWFRGKRA